MPGAMITASHNPKERYNKKGVYAKSKTKRSEEEYRHKCKKAKQSTETENSLNFVR